MSSDGWLTGDSRRRVLQGCWGSLFPVGQNKPPAGTSSCGHCSFKAAGLWQERKKKSFWLNSCWTEEQLAAEVAQISHRSGWNQKGHSKQKRLCVCGRAGERWCICCKSAEWWTPSSGVWTLKGEKLHCKKFTLQRNKKTVSPVFWTYYILGHIFAACPQWQQANFRSASVVCNPSLRLFRLQFSQRNNHACQEEPENLMVLVCCASVQFHKAQFRY